MPAMFAWLTKRRGWDDVQKMKFVELVSDLLRTQMAFTPSDTLQIGTGGVSLKALGYVYGFIDAALRRAGYDMGDSSMSIPITFQVLRKAFPGHEQRYMEIMAENVRGEEMTMGSMVGGQQYLDWSNGKLPSPMGLAKYLFEHDVAEGD